MKAMHKLRLEQKRVDATFEVVGTGRHSRSWPAGERRDDAGRRRLVDRIRGEFLEMRGLALTARDAARLLGVPPAVCARILHTLITEGSLRLTQDGRYARPEQTP
jgi:hypothetical protein